MRIPTSPHVPGQGRWLLVAVILVAFGHGLFVALARPPWGLADEPEHLDYVLTFRDGTGARRIPRITDPLRPDVREAVWKSERWKTHGLPAPTSPKDWIAGGSYSYEGYQPPLYYAVMTPVAALAGDDPLRAMYAIRIVGAIQVAIMAALAAVLTVQWFGPCLPVVPAGAALLTGAIPLVAGSARVTNDGLVALLMSLGFVSAASFLRRPTHGRALAFGLVIGAALLTKSPGLLLLPVGTVVLVIVWRRGELRRWMPLLVLAPGVIAALAWAGLTASRYGTPDGTAALLSLRGIHFDPVPLGPFFWQLWRGSWTASPDAGVIRWIGTGTLTAAVCVAVVGLLLRRRAMVGLGLTALLVAGLVLMIRIGNLSGLVPPLPRVLLSAAVPVMALVAGAWAGLLGPRAPLILGIALALAAAVLRATQGR